jgi:serine/threonine protein kinase
VPIKAQIDRGITPLDYICNIDKNLNAKLDTYKGLKDLLRKSFKIKPQERASVEDLINHSFFKNENEED